MEAEYIAILGALKEAISLFNLLYEFNKGFLPKNRIKEIKIHPILIDN